ncbi:hypothetical protein BN133_594 [Cronobacter dublinensis 582]|nr:hypothetical protein BN133_594 [Cronobacter dublinensis 582]
MLQPGASGFFIPSRSRLSFMSAHSLIAEKPLAFILIKIPRCACVFRGSHGAQAGCKNIPI